MELGDEPLPIIYRIPRIILQVEVKKYANEVVKHMMNFIWELSQESIEKKLDEAPLTEEKAPIDEEMLAE